MGELEKKLTRFPSTHYFVGRVGATEAEIMAEPMLFAADIGFAYANGGPLTRQFLLRLEEVEPDRLSRWVIDSRVHMLKPGWYPAIPGWHLDGIPRDTPDGQPDISNLLPGHDTHYIWYAGGVPTKFIEGGVRLPVSDRRPGENTYGHASRFINRAIQRGEIRSIDYGENAMVRFGNTDFHAAGRADSDCWRFFIRASSDYRKPRNEIRRQVQAYVDDPHRGW